MLSILSVNNNRKELKHNCRISFGPYSHFQCQNERNIFRDDYYDDNNVKCPTMCSAKINRKFFMGGKN